MLTSHRSAGFYRVVLAVPLATFAYLLVSGRWAASSRHFRAAANGAIAPRDVASDFIPGVIWIASLSPLAFAAWEIGREHVAARRLGYKFVIGVREVCRRAFGATAGPSQADDFARPPADRVGVAALWGAVVAVMVPTFFASFSPDLRTGRGLAWVGGAGLLMGLGTYCRRRAMAYLREEPGRWGMFREWRLLNPARYEPAGRAFVRWQIAITVLFPIWWLGGGAALVFRS